jgi:flagellar basal-body rod protein FlgB
VSKLNDFLFVRTGIPKLESYINLTAFRHKMKAGNVANAATPGFKSRDVDFQKEFDKLNNKGSQLEGAVTHSSHIPLGQHKGSSPKVNEKTVPTGEINSVNIDKEIAEMAQNELLFTVGARLLQKKFDGIRNAITSK